MRPPRPTSSVLLTCLACWVAAAPARAGAAQVDPNDPAQASARYRAPPVREPRLQIPGLRDATAAERAGLGLLSVNDQFQADLSRLALDRGLDPDVQAWAESVLDAHASSRGRHDPWLPDLGQPRAQERIRGGQRALAALQDAEASQVSARYLEAMRRNLAETLHLLDAELIPEASTADVVAHLRGLREPLAAELATARRLQPQATLPPGAPP